MLRPDEAAGVIASGVPAPGPGALVVIDGLTGSGKTHLAQGVHAALERHGHDVQLLSTDRLVPGWRALSTGVRHTACLLGALARGGEGRAATWDWERMAPGDELRLAPLAGGVLVVEGCGALAAAAQDLAALCVVRVLVEAPAALRRARISARDGYAWDVEAWQAQERRERAAWQHEARWWPRVLVRHA